MVWLIGLFRLILFFFLIGLDYGLVVYVGNRESWNNEIRYVIILFDGMNRYNFIFLVLIVEF